MFFFSQCNLPTFCVEDQVEVQQSFDVSSAYYAPLLFAKNNKFKKI